MIIYSSDLKSQRYLSHVVEVDICGLGEVNVPDFFLVEGGSTWRYYST